MQCLGLVASDKDTDMASSCNLKHQLSTGILQQPGMEEGTVWELSEGEYSIGIEWALLRHSHFALSFQQCSFFISASLGRFRVSALLHNFSQL